MLLRTFYSATACILVAIVYSACSIIDTPTVTIPSANEQTPVPTPTVSPLQVKTETTPAPQIEIQYSNAKRFEAQQIDGEYEVRSLHSVCVSDHSPEDAGPRRHCAPLPVALLRRQS